MVAIYKTAKLDCKPILVNESAEWLMITWILWHLSTINLNMEKEHYLFLFWWINFNLYIYLIFRCREVEVENIQAIYQLVNILWETKELSKSSRMKHWKTTKFHSLASHGYWCLGLMKSESQSKVICGSDNIICAFIE